jgi:hypothetical protein
LKGPGLTPGVTNVHGTNLDAKLSIGSGHSDAKGRYVRSTISAQ